MTLSDALTLIGDLIAWYAIFQAGRTCIRGRRGDGGRVVVIANNCRIGIGAGEHQYCLTIAASDIRG